VQERLRRASADGNLDEADYERRTCEAEAERASLVVPEEQAVLEAGSYLADVGHIWDKVDVPMRRSIVQAPFDAIQVDVRDRHATEYRPKAAFRRLLLDRRGIHFGDPDGHRHRHCHNPRLPTGYLREYAAA
jgi:hypothetical protein